MESETAGADRLPVARMASIAVLLAAYNGRPWLEEQLESILGQEGVSVTVFVSVDRSSDGTEAWVEDYSKKDRRVILLPAGLRFGGAAPNFFRLIREVDIANFDYISLADQDDLWHLDKLGKAVRTLENTATDCYSSNVVAFWANGTERLIDKAQPQRKWDFLFEAAGPGCTYVFKRKVIADLKRIHGEHSDLFAKVGFHDWFIYAFARAHGYKWIIDPRPSMSYRQHASNEVGANADWRAYVWRAGKILGGSGIAQARLTARIVGLENHPFYRPWKSPGRLGMLWLSLNAFRCRRKVSEIFVFAGICLLMSIVGDRSEE